MEHHIDCEVIRNGILVEDSEGKLHRKGIDEVLEYLCQEVRESYKESRHFEWDGKFSIAIKVTGMVGE